MSIFLPLDDNGTSVQALRFKPGAAHAITTTTSASARNATAFGATTQIVSIFATTDIYLRFGDSSVTAATTDHFFPAGTYYDVSVGGREAQRYTHLAVRAVATGGNVFVSEKE